MEREQHYFLSRRQFVSGLAAMTVMTACGDEQARTLLADPSNPDSVPVDTTMPGPRIDQPAGGDMELATRGTSVQVEETLPPRQVEAGRFITHVATNTNRLSLTLDDGPSPYNTEQILGVCDKYGIKVTFYVVGANVRVWPHILQRAVDAGHQIGNHSEFHTPYTAVGLAPQIASNQQIVKDAVGVTMETSRAPGLTRGAVYMDKVHESGLYEVHTNITTNDSRDPRISASQVLQEHISGHRRGGIPINHDGGNRRPTADAFEPMVQYSLSQGFELVTVKELLASGEPQPAGGTYAQSYAYELDGSLHIDACNYDVYAELENMVNGLELKSAERSRAVEVLAEMDDLRRES